MKNLISKVVISKIVIPLGLFALLIQPGFSQNKGNDGNGYAFQLHSAFGNTFVDLSDRDMRHSVLFSSWHAEHYNAISVSFTDWLTTV